MFAIPVIIIKGISDNSTFNQVYVIDCTAFTNGIEYTRSVCCTKSIQEVHFFGKVSLLESPNINTDDLSLIADIHSKEICIYRVSGNKSQNKKQEMLITTFFRACPNF